MFQAGYNKMKSDITAFCILVWFIFVVYKLFKVGIHLLAAWKFWLFMLGGLFIVCPLIAMFVYLLIRLVSKLCAKLHFSDESITVLGYILLPVDIFLVWFSASRIFILLFNK